MKKGELYDILYRLVNNSIDRGKLYNWFKELLGIGTDVTNIKESIGEGFDATNNIAKVISDNEEVVAGALNDLNNNKANKIVKTTTLPSTGILPNTLYNIGTISENTTINLVAGETDECNIYRLIFNIGTTVPTITWDNSITWVDDEPTLTANKKYKIIITDGIGEYIEF